MTGGGPDRRVAGGRPEPASAFTSGARLRERYLLLEPLGVGGMSQVWHAADELLGRSVAIKVLATPLAADPDLRAATWREARAVAQLSHPHLTQVHDYGEAPLPGGGTAGYLVMELVAGQTLADRLTGGALPPPAAARVASQVAAALAAAHRGGVVHRDVKPSNVMLTETGVKVLDFGIAAMAGSVAVDGDQLVGTPTYAAPERLDPGAPALPASDVYSLGVLFYETLTGSPPASFRSWQELARSDRVIPPTGPDVPERLAVACRDLLAADPAMRPPASEVAVRLSEAGAGAQPEPTVVQPAQVPRQFAPGAAVPSAPATALDGTAVAPARPSRRLLYAGAAVAAVLLALVVVLLVAAWRPGEQPITSAEPSAAVPTEGDAGSVADHEPPAAEPSPAEIIAEFDRALLAAFEDGNVTRDGFDDLRDELDDLRDALDEEDPEDRAEELRDEARDLLEEIDDLREDGEVAPTIADQLASLLAPLLNDG
ncbi:protein kinase [Natronosporangium hydrolyticum]|uniref:non-specific serine/threonine protein kinase n=1 Tax=Natronosporangium hydrolyticum TaxID=2811111 RepID=A0A895YNA3_9ACTN|nr:serine/threonine-protein kinase [Natronosporangium hydrolyticum]QSB16939.1 protein kinase [Natronosporangium hydrolyticum]